MTAIPSTPLTRDDLVEFLREHVSIHVVTNVSHERDDAYVSVQVSLMLEGYEIASSYDSTSLPRS